MYFVIGYFISMLLAFVFDLKASKFNHSVLIFLWFVASTMGFVMSSIIYLIILIFDLK